MRRYYSAHTGNEVSSCVGGVADRPWSFCVHFALEEAVCFKWEWLWASGGHPVASRHLIENGGPWGKGWCCFGCGLVPPFQLGLLSIENIKWILLAIAATPLIHMQLKGHGHTTCTSLMTLMWFRCRIPTSRPHTFGDTLRILTTWAQACEVPAKIVHIIWVYT